MTVILLIQKHLKVNWMLLKIIRKIFPRYDLFEFITVFLDKHVSVNQVSVLTRTLDIAFNCFSSKSVAINLNFEKRFPKGTNLTSSCYIISRAVSTRNKYIKHLFYPKAGFAEIPPQYMRNNVTLAQMSRSQCKF